MYWNSCTDCCLWTSGWLLWSACKQLNCCLCTLVVLLRLYLKIARTTFMVGNLGQVNKFEMHWYSEASLAKLYYIIGPWQVPPRVLMASTIIFRSVFSVPGLFIFSCFLPTAFGGADARCLGCYRIHIEVGRIVYSVATPRNIANDLLRKIMIKTLPKCF